MEPAVVETAVVESTPEPTSEPEVKPVVEPIAAAEEEEEDYEDDYDDDEDMDAMMMSPTQDQPPSKIESVPSKVSSIGDESYGQDDFETPVIAKKASVVTNNTDYGDDDYEDEFE